MFIVYKSIKFFPKFFSLQKYYHSSLSYAHEQCRRPKKVTKGQLVREDDYPLPLYLYVLFNFSIVLSLESFLKVCKKSKLGMINV